MTIELKVPPVGESITEVFIGSWRKKIGEWVGRDEIVVEVESDKSASEIPSPASGVVLKQLKAPGESAKIGEVIAVIEEGPAPEGVAKAPASKTSNGTMDAPRIMPAAEREMAQKGLKPSDVTPTGPGGRILKEDVKKQQDSGIAVRSDTVPAKSESGTIRVSPTTAGGAMKGASPRAEEVVPMSQIRRRIAERLVEAQQTAALLTTFNEVDMSAVMALRQQYKDAYAERHGIKLGFMSFFVKAVIDALRLVPQVNARIEGTNIVHHNYYDIGVAIGGGKGLVVPVIRDADLLSFAEIEKTINYLAERAKNNQITPEDLKGGTFTISNGGVYGSMLSTPIVNPPQSAILGMHAIQDRPVARNGQVVIRPMMYLALTYDHRLIDGREAVTFLKRIKDVIEDPSRMLLEA